MLLSSEMNTKPIPHILPKNISNGAISAGFSLATPELEMTDMGINTITSQDITAGNRIRFAKQLGCMSSQLAYVEQIHGCDIVYADRRGLLGKADGLITNVNDITLNIMVADCAAVLLSDSENRVIGAFHAGWRGAVLGIVPKGVERMRELGAQKLTAWISPCIGTHAFEVGEAVASQFPSSYVLTDGYEKPRVDLQGFIRFQLVQSGLEAGDIKYDERCTHSDDRFYSYRRQGSVSGRMVASITLCS
jgi:YfiH family protein